MSIIAEKAMLVTLRISMWSGTKVDRKVSAEVAAAHKAQTTAGNYNKKLFANNPWMSQFTTLANEMRAYHTSVTLPWLDNGQRVLPGSLYFPYTDKLREIDAKSVEVVNDIVKNYPTAIRQARRDLGDLFNAADYPTADELALKYGISARFMPVPDANDWRVDLGDEEIERIKQEISEEVSAANDEMRLDVWRRLHEMVSKIHERLADPDARFRDSMIETADNTLDLLNELNVTKDPDLTRAINDARVKLTAYEPDVLKEDKLARARTAAHAKDVLDKISDFYSGPSKKAA